jgi:hypothetical protein
MTKTMGVERRNPAARLSPDPPADPILYPTSREALVERTGAVYFIFSFSLALLYSVVGSVLSSSSSSLDLF